MNTRSWTVFVVLVALVSLTSCTWMYMDNDDTAYIEAKTTIKPFSHLKEPIVVTMPVYSNRHLFGNRSFGSMQDQKGDIFVVIDLATDTVWDWIFFPGKHGWTNWRCVEAGSNPTLYCSAGMGSGLVGCLDPTKTTLDVYNAGTKDVVRSYSTPGNHIIIPDDYYDQEAQTLVYRINSFNVKTGRMEGSVEVPTYSIGFFDHPQADPDGNYWFAYVNSGRSKYYIRCYNVKSRSLGDIVLEFAYSYGERTEEIYFASVLYAGSEYIMGYYYNDVKDTDQMIYVYNRQSKETNMLPLPVKATGDVNSGNYPNEIVKIQGKYYCVYPSKDSFNDTVILCEIDLKKKEIRKIATVDIDMTETVYVRGSRLYLMKSRNISDIYYTYYDFSTGKTGRMVNIKYEDVVK